MLKVVFRIIILSKGIGGNAQIHCSKAGSVLAILERSTEILDKYTTYTSSVSSYAYRFKEKEKIEKRGKEKEAMK
jgi:hypothetical protein